MALNMIGHHHKDTYDINKSAFEELFKSNFKALHSYAFTIIHDEEMAEEIVQTVFLKLWEKRDRVDIHTSVKAYLYKSVYHESLNHMKHQKVRRKYLQESMSGMKTEHASMEGSDHELKQRLQDAIGQLPEKCRTVFQLSRLEELKYQEIAEKLGISLKTVESHMGKALKVLRVRLADFLPFLIVLLPTLLKR